MTRTPIGFLPASTYTFVPHSIDKVDFQLIDKNKNTYIIYYELLMLNNNG